MDTPALRPTGTPLTVASAELPIQRTALAALIRERWPIAVLAAILVLAGVVRLYDLVANPPGFFADEASYGYNAYTILHHGKDEFGARFPLFFKAFGEYKLPLYTYSIVPFISALGLSELAIRLTSATYGILTVAALYLFVRALFKNEGFALCSAAMLAILPWHIHYSRTGLGEIIVFPFFLTLSLYLFVLGTRRPSFLIWAGISFGLTLYSYRAAWVVLPLILPVLGALYWRELLRSWQHTVLAVVIIGLFAMPIGLHLLSTNSDRSQDESIFKLHLSLWETFKKFLTNYKSLYTRHFLLEGHGEGNLRHAIPGTGWLYWWQAPFILLGTAALFWRPTRAKVLVLALLAVFPIPSAVTTLSPGSARSIWGAVAFSIVTAYGVVIAAGLVSGWTARREALKPVGVALAGVVFLGIAGYAAYPFTTFLNTYHGEYRQESADFWGWQWGAGKIIDHFQAVEDRYDMLVMDSSFNAPDIFPRFYAPNNCQKCIIGSWDKYDPSKKQLFALRPESAWMTFDYDVKGEVYYPSGPLAFLFVEIDGSHNTLAGMLPNAPDVTLQNLAGIPGDSQRSLAAFNQGNDAWSGGDYSTAYQDYQAAIDASPTFALAFYNRGNIFAVIGQLEAAVSDYIVALRYDPTIAEAHVNMGNAYLLLGKYQEAKVELDSAIQLNPNVALAYVDRGTLHHARGENQLAVADFQKALNLDPNLALANVRRGQVERALGNQAAALVDYGRALELAPNVAETYAARADSYLSTGQYSQAMTDLNRAVDLDKDYALAYARRAVAAISIGNSDRALADLAKAVELDRDYRRAPSNARNPYWNLGDVSKLAAALEQAAGRVNDPSISARLAVYITYMKDRSPG